MCFCCSSYDCSETKQTLVVAQWDVDFESAVSLRRTPLIQPISSSQYKHTPLRCSQCSVMRLSTLTPISA